MSNRTGSQPFVPGPIPGVAEGGHTQPRNTRTLELEDGPVYQVGREAGGGAHDGCSRG
jgi:hypothetical protein